MHRLATTHHVLLQTDDRRNTVAQARPLVVQSANKLYDFL